MCWRFFVSNAQVRFISWLGGDCHGWCHRQKLQFGFGRGDDLEPILVGEGEAQRVSIARALANSPKVILADEPTSSLDDENTEKVIQLLKAQAAKIGAALIIVTHDHRVKNHISNFIEVLAP